MQLLRTTVYGPQDDVVTEDDFGLQVYSLVGRDDLQKLLEIQQKYVNDGTLLFFLRILDEGNREPGDFSFQTYRVFKDLDSCNRCEGEITKFFNEVFAQSDDDDGSFQQHIYEISYDEFVELQAKEGVKYYFAGLADVLDEYE